MLATSLWHTSTTSSNLQKASLKEFGTDYLLIKSRYSLISTGTERLVAMGKVPSSMHESMVVPSMGGSFEFPIKYGYSLVGQIENDQHLAGQLVHLLHPHQDLLTIDKQSISIVPQGIPAKRAALASNMETALNAVWDSGVSVGDKAIVCGFGMIGGLVARVLSLIAAVDVIVLETNEYRIAQAQKMGFTTNPDKLENFDCSFHTSGTSGGLQACIDGVGMEGKIIELSWYGTKSVEVKLGASFHQQRKQIISSQVGQVPFSKSARWNYKRRKEIVWDLLKNPLFDAHITEEIPFAESPAFFDQLRTEAVLNTGLGWVIKY